MITLILAIDKNNLIGNTKGKYGLAWHYEEDMKFYKEQCINKKNLYGRKTLEAIGRILPNREMICMTRNKDYKFENVKIVNEVEEVLNLAENEEIMINGGVEIFKLFFKYADKIIITRIDEEHEGDVYYNDLNLSEFTLTSKTVKDILSFEFWERNENTKYR